MVYRLFICLAPVVKFKIEKDKFPLTCGVRQSSILGPILFLMFFQYFRGSLNFSKSVQFSDDTIIYYSGKSITNKFVIVIHVQIFEIQRVY